MPDRATQLKLAFYGDDFTGSTDALESLSLAGAHTILLLDVPDAATLARHAQAQAVGIAGHSRSMTPSSMEDTLRPAFKRLKNLRAPFVHYKVCSTFDSSPKVGSIGHAIGIGLEIFDSPFVPVVVGAPALGRYCAFGNLFARLGTGKTGEVHRLDRHPSMSRHPVTPADESDLRRHLARQTDLKIGLIDVTQLSRPLEEARAALAELVKTGHRIIFFDALEERHLETIGHLLAPYGTPEQPLFCAGSSGLGRALGLHWQSTGELTPPAAWTPAEAVEPLLVISGSASPVTAAQIAAAREAGFAEVALDTASLLAGQVTHLGEPLERTVKALRAGQSVVVHTCSGPDDPRLKVRVPSGVDTAKVLGTALGQVARQSAGAVNLERVIIAGGDSSSYAGRAMGIQAVEMHAPFASGAPLCRARAPSSTLDGVQLNFKGGQVGAPDYFLAAQRGHL
ncbi:MAG: four-carbon acid sugar kinase family protein [Verrucomicrobiota bacterium JB022]|nr:four-carbon acid sugar kinase family protein [Verrucomicrobiota bacterium JB022]